MFAIAFSTFVPMCGNREFYSHFFWLLSLALPVQNAYIEFEKRATHIQLSRVLQTNEKSLNMVRTVLEISKLVLRIARLLN